jgi:hypothetical protein
MLFTEAHPRCTTSEDPDSDCTAYLADNISIMIWLKNLSDTTSSGTLTAVHKERQHGSMNRQQWSHNICWIPYIFTEKLCSLLRIVDFKLAARFWVLVASHTTWQAYTAIQVTVTTQPNTTCAMTLKDYRARPKPMKVETWTIGWQRLRGGTTSPGKRE